MVNIFYYRWVRRRLTGGRTSMGIFSTWSLWSGCSSGGEDACNICNIQSKKLSYNRIVQHSGWFIFKHLLFFFFPFFLFLSPRTCWRETRGHVMQTLVHSVPTTSSLLSLIILSSSTIFFLCTLSLILRWAIGSSVTSPRSYRRLNPPSICPSWGL